MKITHFDNVFSASGIRVSNLNLVKKFSDLQVFLLKILDEENIF